MTLIAKPYAYAGHIVPHDAKAKELGTGKSRLEALAISPKLLALEQ